jgi:hypothetical protein
MSHKGTQNKLVRWNAVIAEVRILKDDGCANPLG